MGKVLVARYQGKLLKPGVPLDAQGQPITDAQGYVPPAARCAADLRRAKGLRACLPLRDPCRSTVAGGGTMPPESHDGGTTTSGRLTVVIDSLRLVDRAWLVDEIRAMTGYVIALTPGAPALIPGNPERQSRAPGLGRARAGR